MPKSKLLRRVLLENYDDPAGPVHEGHYAPSPPAFNGTVQLVSYNIKFGLRVPEATSEFKIIKPLPQSDIILLQEMDEDGTEKMARVLKYNYVYYPASVHRHGRNFGNAILSRWPIRQAEKFILPRRAPGTNQLRIAAKAIIDFGTTTLLTYSVHTEVYLSSRQHRREQVDAIVQNIEPEADRVVVGGDFNSVRRRHISRLEEQFGSIGMQRLSRGLGPTIRKYKFQPSAADHIFGRGVALKDKGKVPTVVSSDHFPVWVRFELD